MLGNLFNSFHSKKENQDSKTKHSFLKKDSKKDKNKKVRKISKLIMISNQIPYLT